MIRSQLWPGKRKHVELCGYWFLLLTLGPWFSFFCENLNQKNHSVLVFWGKSKIKEPYVLSNTLNDQSSQRPKSTTVEIKALVRPDWLSDMSKGVLRLPLELYWWYHSMRFLHKLIHFLFFWNSGNFIYKLCQIFNNYYKIRIWSISIVGFELQTCRF